MYILEVFIKWLNKRQTTYSGAKDPNFEEIEESLNCVHNFMPVDSTGLTLACTKCGFVVQKKDKSK